MYSNRNERVARMLARTCGDKEIVIVDYDGTLSDGTHRLHLLPKQDHHLTASWLEFNEASINDAPHVDTIHVVNALSRAGKVIVVLTGRSDAVISGSLEWLYANGCHFDYLVMRGADDNRKDTVIKEQFLRAVGLNRILCAYDDSPSVIAHFRAMGITTYAVTEYADKDRHDLKSHGVEHTVQDNALRDIIAETTKNTLLKACQPGGEIYNIAKGNK